MNSRIGASWQQSMDEKQTIERMRAELEAQWQRNLDSDWVQAVAKICDRALQLRGSSSMGGRQITIVRRGRIVRAYKTDDPNTIYFEARYSAREQKYIDTGRTQIENPALRRYFAALKVEVTNRENQLRQQNSWLD